jgi:hypothetical protein
MKRKKVNEQTVTADHRSIIVQSASMMKAKTLRVPHPNNSTHPSSTTDRMFDQRRTRSSATDDASLKKVKQTVN